MFIRLNTVKSIQVLLSSMNSYICIRLIYSKNCNLNAIILFDIIHFYGFKYLLRNRNNFI